MVDEYTKEVIIMRGVYIFNHHTQGTQSVKNSYKKFLFIVTFFLAATALKATPEDVQKFNALLERAQNGEAFAQYDLGVYFELGIGTNQDSQQAFNWFKKSANQGFGPALGDLGSYYRKGLIVQQDPVMAFTLFKKAAKKGYLLAQQNTANCYKIGFGTVCDLKKAAAWYKKAADSGLADAQLSLGLCYYKGEGVVKNDWKALFWLQEAEKKGVKPEGVLLLQFEEAPEAGDDQDIENIKSDSESDSDTLGKATHAA